MLERFLTVIQLEEEYWLVEATGDSTQTKVENKLEPFAKGLDNYTKIGKKKAKEMNLPFLKLNETPQKKYQKEQRRIAKQIHRDKKLQKAQNSLKQDWLKWLSKFDNEQSALVEGLWACEQLAKNLSCNIKSQTENYYMFAEPGQNEDLMRMCQFNELKNLWLKRNQENIVSASKLVQNKQFVPYRFAYTEFYNETFFSYFDNVQLYLYQALIEEKEYTFFSDKMFNIPLKFEQTQCLYEKDLPLEEREKIGKSLGSLVPIIEWGARNFWKKYWSKVENKLLLF